MTVFSLSDIVTITHGKLLSDNAVFVKYPLTDSRRISSPSDSVFFALAGVRQDGHSYINDVYQAGVRCFIVKKGFDEWLNYPDAAFVAVDDTLKALQQLAAFKRSRFLSTVIGITGSNGKTIVKEWLYQVLSLKRSVVRSPRSYNSQIGVPLSLWLLDNNYQAAIIEAGISQPGEMTRLHDMIKPNLGILTHIGPPHQENFISLEHKISEKIKLFRNCRYLVYGMDDLRVHRAVSVSPLLTQTRLITWSAKNKKADLLVDISRRESETVLDAVFDGKRFAVTVPFKDNASVENCITVICAALALGCTVEWISAGIQHLTPVAMRLEMKKARNNCTLINDSYNNDIGSLSIAIDYLFQQNQHLGKVIILSDVLQSGIPEKKLYGEIAAMLRSRPVSGFIGIGPQISQYRSLFTGNCSFYRDTSDFIRSAGQRFSNSAILIKGSRVFEFERIVSLLEEKNHRTVLEIDLSSLVHNLNYFRGLLKPETRVMVMVKALSYGSGTHEIAGILQFSHVDFLGVAFTDEGVTLRKANIHLPVIVMNPDPAGFELLTEYSLEPEIFDLTLLREFISFLRSRGIKNYPVHIKLDTGMHRLGFSEPESGDLIQILKADNTVVVRSVFSHLAASDDPAFDAFTRTQIADFANRTSNMISALGYPVLRHILNSAGVERFPDAQFDMVRLGIGLYGISAVDPSRLQQVSTLKSYLSQIRYLAAGETVGYGRRGLLTRDSVIAVVPIGYADGLNRRLGNGNGCLLVNGMPAPIIGNVCMDMCMIDITGIPAETGDEVIVFGRRQPLSVVAGWLDTIPYEVLTSIPERVKRVYYQE